MGLASPLRTNLRNDWGTPMSTYEFNVVLRDVIEFTDEPSDTLFAAGCDDGLPRQLQRHGVGSLRT